MPPSSGKRRKYARHQVPADLLVAWKTSGQREVSRVEDIGLGGLFLYTPTPPKAGSVVELTFDLPGGNLRALATVRSSIPAKGMGIQFVRMHAADRARLTGFLKPQQVLSDDESASKEAATAGAQASGADASADPARFKADLQKLLELARKGTYYQLLGVSPESPEDVIKRSFYLLARRFHPDHHMDKSELTSSLKDLMAAIIGAHETLQDPEKRAAYDKRLATSGTFSIGRSKSALLEQIEDWLNRANECVQGQNYVGSIVWLRKCVDLAPEKAEYHAMLARSLSMINDEGFGREAVKHFVEAVKLDPWNIETRYQLAEFYEELNLPQEAHSAYSEILEITPGDIRARSRLAALHASLQNR